MAKKDLTPLQGARFEGGRKAMDELIQKNLKYPQAALDNKIEGTVHLFLDINNKGEVTHVKVISGIGYGCDEEAVRVVRLMRFAVEKVRNMHVVYHHKLQIHFKLPTLHKSDTTLPLNPQETAHSLELNYVIVPKVVQNPKPEVAKQAKNTKPKPKVVYQYSI
jgi:TonB family protein